MALISLVLGTIQAKHGRLLSRTLFAPRNDTMEPFVPDFEVIKMDAEVASYQEDFDSEGNERDVNAEPAASDDETASA